MANNYNGVDYEALAKQGKMAEDANKKNVDSYKNPTFAGAAKGGYVAPTQTYTGHTGYREGVDNEKIGTGGGQANPMQGASKSSIKARPDLQSAPAATKQLPTAAKGSFNKVDKIKNRGIAPAPVAGGSPTGAALRASTATPAAGAV